MGISPFSLFCDNVRILRDFREEIWGGIVPMSTEFDLKLSCWRGEVKGLFVGTEILAGAWVKHWKMKMDSRCGSWKISEGNVAEFLQAGLGGVPKSSLETWKWLSVAVYLHSIPGQDEPGWQGLGYDTLQSWSEERVSIILNKVSSSSGSMLEERILSGRLFAAFWLVEQRRMEATISRSWSENEDEQNTFIFIVWALVKEVLC